MMSIHSAPSPEEDLRLVSEFLKAQRRGVGWSTARLADRSGYTPSFINGIEAGKFVPSRKAMRFFLDLMGVDGSPEMNEVLGRCLDRSTCSARVKDKMTEHYGIRAGRRGVIEPDVRLSAVPEPAPDLPWGVVPAQTGRQQFEVRLASLAAALADSLDVADIVRWVEANREALTAVERFRLITAVASEI